MTTLSDGEDPYIPFPKIASNRQKAQQPSKRKFWCSGCDQNRVGQWGKCSVCGYKECPKKKR